MDLRVEYKLATRQQIVDLFSRFYSQELMSKKTKSIQDAEAAAAAGEVVEVKPTKTTKISEDALKLIKKSDNSSFLAAVPTIEQVEKLANDFADLVPADMFSIAQLQGFLLCSKRDPNGAVTGITEWVDERYKEQTDKEARLAKRAHERAKWLKMEKFRQERDKRMEQEAEKELLEEAEKEEKEQKELEEQLEKDGEEGEKKEEAEETEAGEDATEKEVSDADASDKGSEPVMVESQAS